MRDTREVIVRLLRNIGSAKEVDQYVRQYAGVDTQRFAIIKVGGGIIQNQLDSLQSRLEAFPGQSPCRRSDGKRNIPSYPHAERGIEFRGCCLPADPP